jgi:tetratricopeptide (TPR) repeat protein
MSDLFDKYLINDSSLLNKIISYMDQGDFISAHAIAHKRLYEIKNSTTKYEYILKAKLAGLLIDIGEEGQIEKAISEGLKTIQDNRNHFANYIHEGSTEYNLGNAKSGLFRIQRTKSGFKFTPENIVLLTEAKNHFWKAYKLFQSTKEDIIPQLFVNLANTLDTSGRVVEAIQYYDQVLINYPEFPQANASRSEALLFLNNLSGTYSINLLWQSMQGFAKAAQSNDVPKWLKDMWVKKRDYLQIELSRHDHLDEDVNHDLLETKLEAENHTKFRKFCLDKNLCLSEHSLYCNCVGSSSDNLTIPKSTASIGGDFVPKMELRLNRLKSEFALARLLYYESDQKQWGAYDKELSFTELHEDEAVGLRPEMLRTSFRLCFGILDKIAHAICELFDISEPDEPLAFERFWRPRGKGLSRKQQDRWEKLNSIENLSLLALYSQATDLNSYSGEWGNYKDWRNALEHELLVLTKNSEKPLDIFRAIKSSRRIVSVDYYEFKDKTLHLLQLTRSAIFNFVFCVRTEGEKLLGDQGVSITLQPK